MITNLKRRPNKPMQTDGRFAAAADRQDHEPTRLSQYLPFILVVSLLFLAGCQPTPSEETTMLFQAAREGDVETIKELVSNGADVNGKDDRGFTPLHYTSDVSREKMKSMRSLSASTVEEGVAVAFSVSEFDGYIKSAAFLIEMGANRGAKNNDGNTPLELAERAENTGVVKVLKAHGAK